MSDRYENLEKAMCKELEKYDKKYTSELEMDATDADRIDKLYHALKCAETYHAMKDAEEEDGYSGAYRGRSYARGRDARGRYMRSRDMDYSGHYPMDYVDPYWNRGY